MSSRTLEVKLNLDTGHFESNIEDAGKALRLFKGRIEGMNKSAADSKRKFRDIIGSMRDLVIITGQVREAFYTMRLIFVDWVTQIVKVNSEIERATYMLAGLSNELTEVGRRTEAAQNLQALINLSREAPFSLDALTDSFVKMKSVGIDPLDGSLRALTDAVATFGGDSQALHRASIAIQQMGGKGVISMEELRQQLGEAVPRAIELMARSMGMSYRELVDHISKGEVEATSALDKMMGEFDRVFGNNALALMDSFSGAMQSTATEIQKFMTVIGGFNFDTGYFEEGSLMDQLKNQVIEFREALKTNEAQYFATQVGEMLQSVTETVISSIRWIIEYRDNIAQVGAALLKAFAATLVISKIRALERGVIGLIDGYARLKTRIAEVRAESGSLAGSFTRSARSLRGLTSIMATGLTAFAGVTGAIFVVIDALQAFGLFTNKAKEAWTDFQNGFVTQDNIDAISDRISLLQNRMSTLTSQLEANADGIDTSGLLPSEAALAESQAMMDRMRNEERLAEVREELAERQMQLEQMTAQFREESWERSSNSAVEAVRRQVTRINSEYDNLRSAMAEVRTAVENDENLSNEERAEALAAHLEQEIGAVEDYYERVLSVAEGARNEAEAALQEAVSSGMDQNSGAFSELEGAVAGLTSYYADLEDRARSALEVARMDNVFIETTNTGDDGSGQSATERAEGYLARLEARLESLRETTVGFSGEFARMNSLLGQEDFSGISDELRDAILGVATEIDNLKNSANDEEIFAQLSEEFARASVGANNLADVLSGGRINDANEQVERLRSRLNDIASDLTVGAEAAQEQIQAIIDAYQDGQDADVLQDLIEQTRDLERQTMSLGERRRLEFEDEVERINRLIDLNRYSGEERMRVEQVVSDYLQAQRRRLEESQIDIWMRQATDHDELMETMEGRFIDFAESSFDLLADQLIDGKANWNDFAESVLKDITRMILKMLVMMAIQKAINHFGGGGGGFSVSKQQIPTTKFHQGGVVGSKTTRAFVDPAVFTNAMKYHTGGIAGLKPNEVPAILEEGEEVLTKEQRRARSRATPDVNIQMNMINKSGTPLKSTQKSASFDGKSFVIDVIVEEASTPGSPVRDAISQVR